MFKSINKGISTPIAILVIMLLAALAGGIVWQYTRGIKETPQPEEQEEEPYIKVLSPDGGEEWKEGKTHTIKWESSGVNKINIEYGDGKSWYIIRDYPAGTGEYSWTPKGIVNRYGGFVHPENLTEVNIKIGIWDAEGSNIFDKSDDSFILKKEEEGETTNWKTYTNEEYEFGFRYPSKYTVTSTEEEFQIAIQHPQHPEKLRVLAKRMSAKDYEWEGPITGERFWFDAEEDSWRRIDRGNEELSTQPLRFATTTHGAAVYKLVTGDVGVFIREYIVFNDSTNKVIVFQYSGDYNAFDVQDVPPEEIDSFERVLEEIVKTSLFL